MSGNFIALDWGTTSFRAYLATAAGEVVETIAGPEGILSVTDRDFEATLERLIGKWDVTLPVLAAGMITSRQGWIEVPYVSCPAGLDELAAALHYHRTAKGRRIAFSTGLDYRAPNGVPDVMRSEETQVFGNLAGAQGYFVTPGTHSKWIAVEDSRITRFTTYTTGEVFAALKDHTILGRMMVEGPEDEAAFERGVRAALADPAGFLHRIFAARTLALFGEMPPASLASFLSGQVIGSEVAHALTLYPKDANYIVLASPGLAQRYLAAMRIAGVNGQMGDPAAIVSGLARIARRAGLLA